MFGKFFLPLSLTISLCLVDDLNPCIIYLDTYVLAPHDSWKMYEYNHLKKSQV